MAVPERLFASACQSDSVRGAATCPRASVASVAEPAVATRPSARSGAEPSGAAPPALSVRTGAEPSRAGPSVATGPDSLSAGPGAEGDVLASHAPVETAGGLP